MTVANQTNRIAAVGSGAIGQEVPFLFPIKFTSDLLVKKRVTATGVETTLDETTNYTVEISGDIGGTLTTVTVIETTEQIHIIRNTPNTQSLDLVAGGSFSPENIEDALDKNMKIGIENKDAIGKAIIFPATDAASLITELPSSIDRASKNLTFDSDGNVTASVSVEEGNVSFTTFGTDMAEAANALAAKAVMNLDHVFDVRDYGAIGDGVTDDTTAVQAAITAAAVNGGIVFFPTGTYLIDDELEVAGNVGLKGTGRENTILDFSAATGAFANGCCIKAWGTTPTALAALSVNASDRTVTLVASPTLTAGDILLFNDPTDSSWSGHRATYRQGEFATVESVAGAVITLRERLYDTYASATADVSKMTAPISVLIEDLSIVGNSSVSVGLHLKYNHHSLISRINVSGADNVDITVELSVDVNIDNIYVEMASVLDTSEYGIAIAGGQRIFIDKVYGFATHHVIQMSGDVIVNREVHVTDCITKLITPQIGGSGIDIHGIAEWCSIRGCTTEGILVGGNHITVEGNQVVGSWARIWIREQKGNDFTVRNNKIYTTDTSGTTGYGVCISNKSPSTGMTTDTTLGGTMLIENNTCEYTLTDAEEIISVENVSSTADDIVVIVRGNTVKSKAISYHIHIESLSTNMWDKVVCENNTVIYGGIFVRHAKDITFQGNHLSDVLVDAILKEIRAFQILLTGSDEVCTSVIVADNFIRGSITTSCAITGETSNPIEQVIVQNNTFLDNSRLESASGAAFRSALYMKYATTVNITNNVLGGDEALQDFPASYSTITDFRELNNTYFGVGTAQYTTVTGAKVKVIGDFWPGIDNTYYLGKNDDDSPFAWKGLILKDTADGNYYRIESTNGSLVVTDLSD